MDIILGGLVGSFIVVLDIVALSAELPAPLPGEFLMIVSKLELCYPNS